MTTKPTGISAAAYEHAHAAIGKHTTRLTQLQNIVSVCAFACEARRTLESIQDVLAYSPDAKKMLHESVSAINNWAEHEDDTGDTLRMLAYELESINEAMQQIPFELKAMN